jgi:hypothetical protein
MEVTRKLHIWIFIKEKATAHNLLAASIFDVTEIIDRLFDHSSQIEKRKAQLLSSFLSTFEIMNRVRLILRFIDLLSERFLIFHKSE